MKKEKIAAVVVTYNRLELLKECIDGIRNQSRKLDEIIVINNSSSDGTEKWLSKQTDLTTITQENSGSAGGQYTGIKYAYENEYDWIWCMDDDLFIYPECIEMVLNFIDTNKKTKIATIQPLKETISIGKYHGAEFIDLEKFKLVQIGYLAIRNNYVLTNSFCFEGVLINKDTIKKVGFPNKNLFITNDDREFALRIKKNEECGEIVLLGKILMKRLIVNINKEQFILTKIYKVSEWDLFLFMQYFRNFFLSIRLNYPEKFTKIKVFRFLLRHWRWIIKILIAILIFHKNKVKKLGDLYIQIIYKGMN